MEEPPELTMVTEEVEIVADNQTDDEADSAYFGNWTAEDDLALYTAMPHVCDLRMVHANVKFSREFSLNEVVKRWQQLRFNPWIFEAARKRMDEIPDSEVKRIQSLTPFSKKENNLLLSIVLGDLNLSPSLEMMEDLLWKYQHYFHSTRTPQKLWDQWHVLNSYDELASIHQQNMAKWCKVLRIKCKKSSAGDGNSDGNTASDSTPTKRCRSKQSKSISPKLPSPVKILATIVGRVVRYVMSTDTVLIGCASHHTRVDIDLRREGSTYKLARKIALIQHDAANERFVLTNISDNLIFADGNGIRPGRNVQLKPQAIIRIATIRLVFLATPS